MATESDLRDLLRDPDPEGRSTIDLDAVLTRARRRRRPRVVAAQAIGSVAVVGAVFTGVVATLPPEQPTAMIAEDAGGPEFASEPAPPGADLRWAMDACGEPPVVGASATWALQTEVAGNRDSLIATLTLRNLGRDAASGVVTPWSLTVVHDGVVVGRASVLDSATSAFDLESGASFAATLDAVVESCEAGASLDAGSYEVRGVVEVIDDTADGRNEVVYGELVPVDLR